VDPKMMRSAMSEVVDSMGHAARGMKAKRFKKKEAVVTLGEPEISGEGHLEEMDPVKANPEMSAEEMAELLAGIQR